MRLDAKSTERGKLNGRGRDAQFQPLQIFHFQNRFLVIGNAPVTADHPAQRARFGFLGDLIGEHVGKRFITQHGIGFVQVGKKVGQNKRIDRGGKRRQVAVEEGGDMQLAIAQLLDVGGFIAHGAAQEEFHLNGAFRFLFYDFLEFVQRDRMRAGQAVGGGRHDGLLLVFRGKCRCRHQRGTGDSDGGEQK